MRKLSCRPSRPPSPPPSRVGILFICFFHHFSLVFSLFLAVTSSNIHYFIFLEKNNLFFSRSPLLRTLISLRGCRLYHYYTIIFVMLILPWKPTFGNVTSAQFVPDHHFVILILPVVPSVGAPWYAIQSTVAKGLKLFPFLPDCIAHTVKFCVLIFSVQDVIAWCTVTESFKFM